MLDQPGMFTENGRSARDLNTKGRSARDLNRKCVDQPGLNTKCRSARDLTQNVDRPGIDKMVDWPGTLTKNVDQPGISTECARSARDLNKEKEEKRWLDKPLCPTSVSPPDDLSVERGPVVHPC